MTKAEAHIALPQGELAAMHGAVDEAAEEKCARRSLIRCSYRSTREVPRAHGACAADALRERAAAVRGAPRGHPPVPVAPSSACAAAIDDFCESTKRQHDRAPTVIAD